MGVNHVMGVGKSPGAVTAALSYFLHHERDYIAEKEGSIIENVVIFCSWDVYEGHTKSEDCTHNRYGTNQGTMWRRRSVREVIADFLKDDEIGQRMKSERAKLYVLPVDVMDYEVCFETVARTIIALARPDDTGKRLWVNLTGGTNVLNTALMQAASLSALVDRIYYAFLQNVSDQKYLRPPSTDEQRFRVASISHIKTIYDEQYYQVLEQLDTLPTGEWIMGRELWSKLRCAKTSRDLFATIAFDHFKNQYLNRMGEDVLEEQKGKPGEVDRPIRISPRGREVLEHVMLNDWVEALVHRDKIKSKIVETCRDELSRYTLNF